MPDFNPNFLARDPVTGLTFYDFDGHIHAKGLDLDTTLNTGIPDLDKEIKWTRADTGKLTGEIYSLTNPSGTEDNATLIRNWNQAGTKSAIIEAATSPQPSVVKASADQQTKEIIRGDGTSDFLKLVINANRNIAIKKGAISWPGGSAQSNTMNVAHGLTDINFNPITPQFFVFFMFDQSGTGPSRATGVTCDNTNIVAYFITDNGFAPAAGNLGTYCAIAIG